MKRWQIGLLKYLLLIAHFGSSKQFEKHNVVINETVESLFWNKTDYNVSNPYNNSIESELLDGCEPNPCMNDGICMYSDKNAFCFCIEPFSGPRCEINPCVPNPCHNNGQCEINEDGFECTCKDSFFGKLCKNVLDLCLDNPCKNDGLCRMENGLFKCDCKGPYAGNNCEKDCDCGDAVCELDANGYQKECNCTENQILYKGKCVECDCGAASCQLDIAGKKECICHKNQTLHRGKCVECDCGERSRLCYFDYQGRKRCVCLSGSAELEGICSVCSCGENSRSCLFNEQGEIVCYCKTGFSQKNNTCYETCDSDYDCFHSGLCIKEDGTNFCNCRSGFSGDRCQIDDICESMKDRCDAMGAVCVREGAILGSCVCPQNKVYGWRTQMCEDICDARKCGHGSCIVTGKDYKCICDPGFTGMHCDETIKITKIKSDVPYEAIVLVILCFGIVGFTIGTICLIQRNRKLIKNLRQSRATQEPRI